MLRRWTNELFDLWNNENETKYSRKGDVINSYTKFVLVCPNGHDYTTNVDSFVNKGARCKECWKASIRTDKLGDFLSALRDEGFTPLEEYKNGATGMKIRCPNGSITTTTPSDFIKKKSRCGCAGCRSESTKKLKQEHSVLSKYLRDRQRAKNLRNVDIGRILSQECGCKEYWYNQYINGRQLQIDIDRYNCLKKTLDLDDRFDEIVVKSKINKLKSCDLVTDLEKLGYRIRDGLSNLNGSKPITVICMTCDRESIIKPNNTIKKSYRCVYCFGKRKLSTKEYLERLNEVSPNYSLAEGEEYINSQNPLKHICDKNHVFEASPSNLIYGKTKCPICFKERYSLLMSGNSNHNWNFDLTDEQRLERENRRNDSRYYKWSKQVKERDGFICLICGENKKKVISHHLYSYDIHRDMRFEINNGVTLCESCHKGFHNAFGWGKNTKDQFELYISFLKDENKKCII